MSPWPFRLHLLGASVTSILVGVVACGKHTSPPLFDPFRLTGTSQFAGTGLVFYGFSLFVLRRFPMRVFAGSFYAALSCLLFALSFMPRTQGLMMRRVADPVLYGQLIPVQDTIGFLAMVAFVILQSAFLWHAARSSRISTSAA